MTYYSLQQLAILFMICFFFSLDVTSCSDFVLLEVAVQQNRTISGKENSFGIYVNKRIGEPGGFQIRCNT